MSGDILGWLLEGRLDVAVLYDSDRTMPVPATALVDDDLYLIGARERLPCAAGRKFRFATCRASRCSTRRPRHSLRLLLDHTARQLD